MKKRKALVIVILLATVSLGIGFIIRRSVGDKPVPRMSAVAKSARNTPLEELVQIKQEAYSFKVEGFDKERKVLWGLEGKSGSVVLDKINITDLKAVYYGGDETLTVFADRAVYDKKTQDIELKDNIVGKTSDGGELVADYAKWNAKTEEITTDSHVIVKRENLMCRGRGLITKPRLKWVVFQKEVVADFGPDKRIVCSGPFEIDHEKNVAVFNKDVKIIDKDSETFADKLTVYLDPETNKVKTVVTEGNVRVVYKGEIEDMEDTGKISF